ncbi:hypothetical protein [Jatrophihabitans fulvus]
MTSTQNPDRPDAPQPDDEQPVTAGTLEPTPEHDEVAPALNDDPEPDEPGGERQAKPSDGLAQDDELRSGQWGPSA